MASPDVAQVHQLWKYNVDSPSDSDVQPTFTDQALLEALKILEQLAEDRGLLARLGKEDCSRLIQAAEAIAKALKKK